MALPQQLKAARLTNSSLGSAIDDELGNAEKALADILGIPINTNITVALFEAVAGGLKSIILSDAAADPSTTGWIRRNSTRLKFYNGTRAEDLVCIGGGGGNKVMFQQTAVPTGWTRIVDASKTESVPMLRLNSEVPGSGGTWTISGLTMSHTHTVSSTTATYDGSGASAAVNSVTSPTGSASTSTVASSGAWRPKYVDFIVGSKD